MDLLLEKTDSEIISLSLIEPRRFEVIFDRHFASIHGYFSRREGSQMADDLSALVFMKAFELRERYMSENDNCLPWLYGISSKILSVSRRTKKRHFYRDQRAHEKYKTETITFDSNDGIYTSHECELIHSALMSLKRTEREVILLLAWEQLTYPEIAFALGIPIGTVKSRINRARKTLMHVLTDFSFDDKVSFIPSTTTS